MSVSLPAERLFRRFDDVRAFVTPLLADVSLFEATRLTQVRDYTVGVIPRGYSIESVIDPSALRNQTKWDNIFFNYHERWVPTDSSGRFVLERSYLHFYLKDKGDLQAVSLHCDPCLEKSETNFQYKRGPHLHLAGGEPDISRAHLSVCVSDKAYGGNNLGSLTKSLKSALGMVVDELIPTYQRFSD